MNEELSLEDIKEFSRKGEYEFESEYLDVPPGGHKTGKIFKLEDVKKCFSKPFAWRVGIAVVGSLVTHPQGDANDIDMVIFTDGLPEDIVKAIKFRLYRAFSGYFNVPYDETPRYLHLHEKESGKSPFTDFVYIYNFGSIPVLDEERTIHKMCACEIIEKSEKRIIGGLASTSAIDLENERVTRHALESIWDHIQKTPEKYRNLMISHSSVQVGTIIDSYKDKKSELREDGLYLLAELRTDLDAANKVWDEICKGEIHSFSIKIEIPEPVEDHVKTTCEGSGKSKRCWTDLLDAKFIEYSLTKAPANPMTNRLEILAGHNDTE